MSHETTVGMRQESASTEGKRPVRIGKYEVIAHIATGGMGAVYKAIDTDLQRLVALKILAPELAAKPSMVERFKREGRSAAKLRHKNIVAIHECGELGDTHFLALEFVDGVDLHDYVAQRRQLDLAEARQILIQAARALDHAHRHQIVHRDVKPSNFLITKNDRGRLLVKLTDLGLARQVNDDEFRVTKADSTIGTVDYMSPEQAQNSGSADIRSDIYSLGCTFFHMLAGKCPFPTGTLVERVLKHREAEPPDIRTLNAAVPAPVARILGKMLAKKPADRYQTPRELLQELDNPANFPVMLSKDDPRLVPLGPGPEPRPPKRKTEPERPVQPTEVPPTVEYMRRDKTEEFRRLEKASKSKQSREFPSDKLRSKRGRGAQAAWWPWAAGSSAGVLILALVLWRLLGTSAPGDEDEPDQRQAVVTKKKPSVEPKPAPEKKLNQGKMGPEAPILPRLYQPAQPVDRLALRREFLGPLQTMAAPPPAAKVVKVRRLPGPAEYRSVGEALAKTSGPVVIEIHDQGPLFEASWPAVSQRSVWIRGGAGFRPLLAWDVAADTTKIIASPLLALTDGTLTLEDVDFVAKWPAGRGLGPDCLFAVRDGHFQARDCTFTVAGKFPRGLALVMTERTAPLATAALVTVPPEPDQPPVAARVHFRRCFARGSDLAVLDARSTPLDALIEGSLLVCGDRPMFQMTGQEQDNVTLRFVRSTLVCGQNCIRWNSLNGQPSSPRIQVMAWDALLARANAAAAQGDMLFLADGADSEHVTWRPVNCLYAGWKRLLFSADKSIASAALPTWRALLSIREGDRELADAWPPALPADSETLPVQAFAPYDTAALFAATGGPGALGCELGRLPQEPYLALQRTYERYPMPIVSLPAADGPPPIPVAEDGHYHGERLDLTNVDLGKYLQERLGKTKPGPRVVLHLTGKGRQYTSPIKVSGVAKLVLFFEPPGSPTEPFTLLPKPQVPDDGSPMIDVVGGGLEVIGARLAMENKPGTAPVHLIKMRGGDLTLNRCYLQGFLDKTPDGYQGLIRFEDTSDGSGRLAEVLLQDSVLLSARNLLDVHGGARVRIRNCAAVAADDGLTVAPALTSRPNVFVQLDNNTFAFRKALVAVRAEQESSDNFQGIVLQAQRNYFVNPFADEPRQARMVRIAASDLAHGALLWQGKQNAFDHLRLGYVAADDVPRKQPFKEWRQVWGTPGEQDASNVDGVKLFKAFTSSPPSWPHLALPPRLRPVSGPPPFGADLVGLGLLKRKE